MQSVASMIEGIWEFDDTKYRESLTKIHSV